MELKKEEKSSSIGLRCTKKELKELKKKAKKYSGGNLSRFLICAGLIYSGKFGGDK